MYMITGHKVAIKIQKITNENKTAIEEEYKILRDLSEHHNLPDFCGVYKRTDGNKNYIWFVMEVKLNLLLHSAIIILITLFYILYLSLWAEKFYRYAYKF